MIELPDEVHNLAIGQTASGLVCPTCNGGSNRDRSFSCTRVERGFVYHCFRAKCSTKGYCAFSAGWGRAAEVQRGVSRNGAQAKPTERRYLQPIVDTPSEVKALIDQRYGIREATLSAFGVGWSPPQGDRVGRLTIPVLLPDGASGGLIARSLDRDSSEPKTLNYTTRPGGMSWFRVQDVREGMVVLHVHVPKVWVVEDQFSAMRLWQEGHTAVALLGTHLNHSRVVEIGSVAGDAPVLLALDRDATNKSIEYASVFRYALNLKVVALTRDIKDMNEQELKELLR